MLWDGDMEYTPCGFTLCPAPLQSYVLVLVLMGPMLYPWLCWELPTAPKRCSSKEPGYIPMPCSQEHPCSQQQGHTATPQHPAHCQPWGHAAVLQHRRAVGDTAASLLGLSTPSHFGARRSRRAPVGAVPTRGEAWAELCH